MKIDENGDSTWNRTYKSFPINREDFYGMVVRWQNSLTDLILGGKVSEILTQDQGYVLGQGEWMFKTNQAGVIEWNQTYTGQIYSICQLNDGGIIAAIYRKSTLLERGSFRDVWIAKTDSSGSILWEKLIEIHPDESLLGKNEENTTGKKSQRIAFLPSGESILFLRLLVYLHKRRKKYQN